MCAWGVIRNVRDEDYEALDKSARRFAARHNLTQKIEQEMKFQKSIGYNLSWYGSVDNYIETYININEGGCRHADAHYLAMLWKRCIRRALGEPSADGIAYDTVGYVSE
jgi:hypothetical protein